MKAVKIISLAVAAVAMVMVAGSPAHAGDAAKGKKTSKKCKACHSFKQGDKKKKTGPNLFGVMGRKLGVAKFKYSKGYKAAAAAKPDFAWSAESVAEYVGNPNKYLSSLAGKKVRSKMTYKLKKAADRENIAAFLGTLK